MGMKPGLEGVAAAETKISLVDGERGRLIYRGHRAEDLARTRSPEEVAFLLWNGTLPDPDEREAVRRQWAGARVLPGYLKGLIAAIPREVQMTDVLRTAVSAMGDASFEGPPTPEQAIRIAALLPSIIAFRRHHLAGTEPPAPADQAPTRRLSTAAATAPTRAISDSPDIATPVSPQRVVPPPPPPVARPQPAPVAPRSGPSFFGRLVRAFGVLLLIALLAAAIAAAVLTLTDAGQDSDVGRLISDQIDQQIDNLRDFIERNLP